jgi:hypothetical protein
MTKHGFGFNRESHPKSMAERVKLREAKVTPLMLPLVELADGCRYPYGDSDYKFCGLSRMASSVPYCEPHYRLCNTPRIPRGLTVPSSLAARSRARRLSNESATQATTMPAVLGACCMIIATCPRSPVSSSLPRSSA